MGISEENGEEEKRREEKKKRRRREEAGEGTASTNVLRQEELGMLYNMEKASMGVA